MLRKITLSFGMILCTQGAFSAIPTNVSHLRNEWGGGKMLRCGIHMLLNNLPDACIGVSSGENCATYKLNARNYSDEFMVLMMVARDINEHGAYFCPTQVEGKNKNKSHAWTEYADAHGPCHWLCKNGWGGDRCQTQVPEDCDATRIQKSDYANIGRVASGSNIENAVVMFDRAITDKCGLHGTQEHDNILAIVRYAPGGHGAFVRQMIVRSERDGWGDMKSTATVYLAEGSQEILVCKPG